MRGMLIPTIVSATIIAGLFGVLAYHQGDRLPKYIMLFSMAILLNPIGNLLLKAPVYSKIEKSIGLESFSKAPWWYLIFTLIWVGIIEETIKLLPLIIPVFHNNAGIVKSPTMVAWSLGAGFGLGEALFLGYKFSFQPDIKNLPFYMLGGFVGERIYATFLHITMTGVALYLWQHSIIDLVGGWGLAVLLHMVADTGPMLYQAKLISENSIQIMMLLEAILFVIIFQRVFLR